MYNSLLNFLTPRSMGLTSYTIEGVQSGTLPLGDYTVEGDIVVEEGAALTLTAGSIFRMKDNVLWEIQGQLTASGSSSNPIKFQLASGGTRWLGIRFCKENHTDTSTMTADDAADTISVSFGLNNDWPIRFTTTGTLPAPLEVGQRYYIVNSNQLAKRQGGSPIDITDTGSGTHTAYRLNPNSSSIESSDSLLTQTLEYCEFYDADGKSLPSNLSLSYRHWKRGGGLMAHALENMTFDNLSFYRCGAEDRGGASYIQGRTSTAVAVSFDGWYFEDCEATDELAGGYAQSHGQAGTSLSNFEFVNTACPAVEGSNFTADDAADTITVSGATFQDNNPVRNLTTTGTLPGGLSASTVYYCKNSSGDTCQLSLTPGGAAVDITDTGSGSHSCDPQVEYQTFDTSLSVSGFTFS